MRKLLLLAATSIALAAAPAIASAQQAAAPSTRAAEVQPASEQVDGSEFRFRGGFILPLLLVVGIVVALLLTIDEEKQDFPVSP